MTDWMETLRRACKEKSQARVAAILGVSSAMISQALKGKYPGSTTTLKQRVEGALMGYTVNCPVLGDIPANTCLDHQRAPFAATNSQRVRLYRACRNGCPHSRREDH
ncbi:MAG: helix-turn-helix transcriptional regulator [Aquisalimonadaceae bacterium]